MSLQPSPIEALPSELKRTVFDYLPLPSDLSNLSRTCKTLHASAAACLYQRVVLAYALPKYPYDLRERYRTTDIVAIHNEQERKLVERIRHVFKEGSTGNEIVREVYLKMRLSSRWTPFRSPYLPARALIESLPPNQLRAFYFDSAPFGQSCFTVTVPDLVLLCDKQRELRYLKLSHPFFTGQTKRTFTIEGKLPGEGDFQLPHLETLVLEWMPFYEESDTVLKIGQNLLENCPKLTTFSLARLQSNIVNEDPFHSLLTVNPPNPANIRSLCLHRISLQNMDAAEISVISFKSLEKLELNYVSGGYKLLEAIWAHHSGEESSLKALKLCESTPSWEFLEKFLASFSNLRLFFLSYTRESYEEKFDMDCLKSHSTSLQSLLLEVTTPVRNYPAPRILPYLDEEMDWICTTFPNLRELGLNLDIASYSSPGPNRIHVEDLRLSSLQHLHTFNDCARDHTPLFAKPHYDTQDEEVPEITVGKRPPNLRMFVIGTHGRSHDRQIFRVQDSANQPSDILKLAQVSRTKLSFLEPDAPPLANWEPIPSDFGNFQHAFNLERYENIRCHYLDNLRRVDHLNFLFSKSCGPIVYWMGMRDMIPTVATLWTVETQWPIECPQIISCHYLHAMNISAEPVRLSLELLPADVIRAALQ